nr:DUF4262 domain-containing protein [Piscicoccus intestinalis]
MSTTTAELAYEDQVRRRMIDAIRRFGCWCTYVFGDDMPCDCHECAALGPAQPDPGDPEGSGDHPAFCYTTGLHGIGHPEFIVHALDQEASARVLNEATHMVLHGRDFTPGEQLTVGGLVVTVEAVPNPGDIFFVATTSTSDRRRPPSPGSS